MAEVKTISKSANFIQVSGVLLEKNLEIVTEEVEITDFNNNNAKKKVTCEVAKKKEFKNPALLIEVSPKDEDGNVLYTTQAEVDFSNIGFGVASKTFDKDGKIVDNDNFKGIKTVLETYIPKSEAKDGEEPTRVFVKNGFLSPNEYVDKKTFDYKVYNPIITTYNVTSGGVPDDIIEGNMSGIIRSIIPETKGENADETGRLKVELFSFKKNGSTNPYTFIVEKDLADDFNDLYSAGDSVKIYYEVLSKQVGAKKVETSGGFGRRNTKTTSGYTVQELSIFRGEDPIEEENELFIDKELMKKAMAERQNEIDVAIQKAKDKAKNGTTTEKKSGLGNRASKAVEDTSSDGSLPF